MKREIAVFLIITMVLSLSACGKTLKGTDGLIEKAREEIPISDSDTIDLQYAGMCGNDNRAIAWFISGNEYQKHYYLPMEVEVKEDAAEYTFIRTYKPIDDRIGDIAYIQWGDGYAFIVNNTNCKSVRFTSGNEVYEEVIPDDTYPYVFFYLSDHTNSTLQFEFLDAEGNPIWLRSTSSNMTNLFDKSTDSYSSCIVLLSTLKSIPSRPTTPFAIVLAMSLPAIAASPFAESAFARSSR